MAAIGEIFRLVISYTGINASIAQNVFYWELIDAVADDADVLDELETFVDTIWGPQWAVNSENSWSITLSEVDVINPDGTVDRNLGEANYAIAGGDTAGALAAAVSGYIQASTTRAKSLGKKYVPGYGEGAITDGAFLAGVVTNLLTMLVQWQTGLPVTGGGQLEPGVLSRVLESFLFFNGSGLVTDIPAYQRRRKPGVGS